MKLAVIMEQNEFGGKPAKDYSIEVRKPEDPASQIVIEFIFTDAYGQKGGMLHLKPEIASWLGKALLAASTENLGSSSLKTIITGEKQVF